MCIWSGSLLFQLLHSLRYTLEVFGLCILCEHARGFLSIKAGRTPEYSRGIHTHSCHRMNTLSDARTVNVLGIIHV